MNLTTRDLIRHKMRALPMRHLAVWS